MELTKIEKQKNNPKRLNLYLNGNFWLGVSRETFIKHNLKKGLEINKKQKNEIEKEESLSKAFDCSLKYLSYRSRSRQEIREYLKKKEFNNDIIDKTIVKLKKYNYLDDQRFLIDFTNSLIAKNKGPKYIISKLLTKGFKKNKIEKTLKDCYTNKKQRKVCRQTAKKYLKKKKLNLNNYQDKQKLFRFLAQRGIEYDIIKGIIENINNH
jgi:regulatory protein